MVEMMKQKKKVLDLLSQVTLNLKVQKKEKNLKMEKKNSAKMSLNAILQVTMNQIVMSPQKTSQIVILLQMMMTQSTFQATMMMA